ncbi:glycosyltransferase family A protein [Micromonospora sp. NPDC049101]|uniref:glycosyltransferase family A protein n=1 Tax=unclassified Micromonospora TaxID=2617518 RepID=UPI0033CAF885
MSEERMEPLVSIVVPNYNGADTLPLCLRSLQGQTYPNIEIIIVDDGSSDDSLAIAKRFGVTVTSTGSNMGCGVARNTGVARSTGEIVFYVDSDIALASDAVASAVAILRGDSTIGAVCGVQDAEPLVNRTLVAQYRGLQYHYWSASSVGDVSFMFPSLCAIPTKVHTEIGSFNPKLKQTEEVDFGYRLSQRYRLRLSQAVRGRHAHDPRLRILLRKLFHRARLRVPLYADARHFANGFETRQRAWASLAAAASLPAFLLPLILGPAGLLGPVLMLAVSIACDAGMYRFVFRRRGLAFLAFFVATHYVVNLTIVAGVAVGAVQWSASRTFRRLYEEHDLQPAS